MTRCASSRSNMPTRTFATIAALPKRSAKVESRLRPKTELSTTRTVQVASDCRRQANALSVFLARHPLVLDVERRGADDTVEALRNFAPPPPVLHLERLGEADERGPHSPHHLNRTRAEVSDLVERDG